MSIQQTSRALPRADLGGALMSFVLDGPGASRFIADDVLPLFPVPLKASYFPKRTRNNVFQLEDVERAMGSVYNRVDVEMSQDSYACSEKGLEHILPDDVRRLYNEDFDSEFVAVQEIDFKLRLRREKRVADMLVSTTWTSGGASLYTDNSATAWDGGATEFTDIQQQVSAAQALGVTNGVGMYNVAIIPFSRFLNMKNLVQARFSRLEDMGMRAITAALADMLGLDRILVPDSVYNTANPVATVALEPIWSGDYVMLLKIHEGGSLGLGQGLGRTFIWTADSPMDPVVEQYREEQRRADVFRVRHSLDEKLFDPWWGHLMKVS